VDYMDSYDKTDLLFSQEEELLNEAKGLNGMMAEVAVKARLLMQDLDKEKALKEATGEELVPSDAIQKRMSSLMADFHRYSSEFDVVSDSLREIYDEIKDSSGLDYS